MIKHPLWSYVLAVVIVFAVLNLIAYFYGTGKFRFQTILIFSLGFLVGMLAMFIAVHIYTWK